MYAANTLPVNRIAEHTYGPGVSVIIPTYNCAPYIADAVDSALGQTYKNIEIIVVDDGSTDETWNVIRRYGSTISYIYQGNSGVSAARNNGITHARGRYIAFLDADDVWLEDKLQCQVGALEENPEVGMIFTDGVKFDDEGRLKGSLKPTDCRATLFCDPGGFWRKITEAPVNDGAVYKGDFYPDMMMGNLVFFTSSVLVRSECLRRIGLLEERLHSSEDYHLWLRLARHYHLLYLNRVTGKYRHRYDSLCGPDDMRMYYYRKWDGIMFERYAADCPEERARFIARACECYKAAIWGYFRHGDMRDVRMLCCRFLRHNQMRAKIYFYMFLSFLPVKLLNRFFKQAGGT